jgi:hypothetical protein
MVNTKTLTPLTTKLKIILTYMYFISVGSAIAALAFAFSSDQFLRDSGLANFEDRVVFIVTYTIIAVLYAWVIYLLHKRKTQAGIAFVITVLVTYSLGNLQPSSSDLLLSTIILATILTAIDVVIAIFLLQSSEAKSILKSKG